MGLGTKHFYQGTKHSKKLLNAIFFGDFLWKSFIEKHFF